MKSLIKQLLRENLLSEKLTDVDDDVNLLYERYFEFDVNKLEQTGIITDDMFINTKINTSILESRESVETHNINPCTIIINTGSNYYKPHGSVISLSVNGNAKDYIKNEAGGDYKEAIIALHNPHQRLTLSREFSEERIKGSIHHELAHWIDDTMHNKHITKRIDKAMELKSRDFGGVSINATKMEIQAQIHNIKQLHNKYSDIWDTLTFYDMLKYSPSIIAVYNSLKGDIKTNWIRDLKTRMHRENLLGKNMY